MISLPIPDKTSHVRYRDLSWRDRNLGQLVSAITRGKQRDSYGAHLDPDLRRDLKPRLPGWRPVLGQHGLAQGHLQKQNVSAGDVFIFWGLFRPVDAALRWVGPSRHYIWGWLQVDAVVSVDECVRDGGEPWRWLGDHPHLAFEPDPSNTLYVAAERLRVPGLPVGGDIPGAGVFDKAANERCLTAVPEEGPSPWSLPGWFFPATRTPMTFHRDMSRWVRAGDRALLDVVNRGQEFVLDLDEYPEAVDWIGSLLKDA